MKTLSVFMALVFLMGNLGAAEAKKQPLKYPETKKGEQMDEYHGVKVADPYRWLEDMNSDDTKNWVQTQAKFTNDYLSAIPFREAIKKRFTELWNYEKYSQPFRLKDDTYIFFKNNGLQEQSVMYIQKGLEGKPEVLLDPNALSADGSVSLAGFDFSNDYKYLTYGVSRGGSDWNEYFVMNIETREKMTDHIKWMKFSNTSWYKDGFYYSRYDEPKEGEQLKAQNVFQKVYYHKLGTPQSEDKLVYEDKTNPQLGFNVGVSDDEKHMFLYLWEGSAVHNMFYYKSLEKGTDYQKIVNEKIGTFGVVDVVDNAILAVTNYNAPNYRLIAIDLAKPEKQNWRDVIPESTDKLNSVSYVGGKLIASYLKDATTRIYIHELTGKRLYEVELPGVGSAGGFGGKKEDMEVFYTYTSFITPPVIYRYDIAANKSTLFRKANIKFNSGDYETKQIFYKSKDGTSIPMFIAYKKGLKLDGNNPALLTAYGGFNVSMRPSFNITAIPLLDNGGVFAMACLRGGGEYGEEWHKNGMLDKKQNVFDDFIAAAEYLIAEKYTSSKKLAIQGGSNGGLLVGAVINQRPELFAVAFPMVGVMDMLRFHKFTIGWAWASEYGSSDNADQFKYLMPYSPLHNIREGMNYPATLVTTADHDDRVFPAHSFKYISQLQAKHKGDNPVLIRIETKVGHGAGTSTSKAIELYSDLYAFTFYNMGITPVFPK